MTEIDKIKQELEKRNAEARAKAGLKIQPIFIRKDVVEANEKTQKNWSERVRKFAGTCDREQFRRALEKARRRG